MIKDKLKKHRAFLSAKQAAAMTNQTNLVAIDKVLAAVRSSSTSYIAAAARCSSIGERIIRAVHEVCMTLPVHQRAIRS